jgi:hypothetical protein
VETWDTYDIKVDGQTDWLVHLYETTINGIRENGLPSEVSYVLSVEVPTLAEQAKVMRYRDSLPPGHNKPTGILD